MVVLFCFVKLDVPFDIIIIVCFEVITEEKINSFYQFTLWIS